jgi:TonB family protein
LVYRGVSEIMSTSPFNSAESPRSPERRRFNRQRVRSLAYLDVVPNNGGIVLNLSENGLALQAVNPFDETHVSLRIQPPKSRKRIEASAEITWISESKREAGLQFLGLTEDARTEIAEWVAAEADIGERRPHNDSPALPTPPQPPPKQIVAEPPRLREKWSAMLGDSPSEVALTNLEPSANSANSPEVRTQPKSQPGAALPKRFVSAPVNAPVSNVTVIHSPIANRNDTPPNPVVPSTLASRVVEFPAPEAQLPAAEELFREAPLPPPPGDAVRPVEPATAMAPVPHAESLEHFAHRFRKPLSIAALCAAAVIFLFAGMEIIRQRPTTGPTRSNVQEGPRLPDAASASPVAADALSGAAASHSGASHPPTTHTTLRAIASAFRRKISKTGYKEDPHPSRPADNEDTPAAKFSSPIEPAPLRPTIPAQNINVASAPVLPVAPVTSPGLVAGSPEIDPPPPANFQRRSDCYLLYRVEPLYPRDAKERRIEGTVTIHLQIGADGKVQNLRELSGPSLLVPAALEAAREWRFIPALLNGQPIGAEKDVSIVFQLPR